MHYCLKHYTFTATKSTNGTLCQHTQSGADEAFWIPTCKYVSNVLKPNKLHIMLTYISIVAVLPTWILIASQALCFAIEWPGMQDLVAQEYCLSALVMPDRNFRTNGGFIPSTILLYCAQMISNSNMLYGSGNEVGIFTF